MSTIFGPVPSRRLGLSLGVDLIPRKTCTYDCLYCQVGRTTHKIIESLTHIPIQDIINELKDCLDRTQPDAITLAGSGEPTLNTQIDQAISAIKEMTPIQVAILTNGSLLWREDVLNRILEADIIMPTLTTVFQDTFTAIHRPHPDLHLPTIIKGFKKLRNAFSGHIYMEVVLLAGFNDSDQEIEGLHDVLTQISPDKIQLNTVVRPPADPHARPLDPQQLETIKTFLGEKAEIIVHTPRNQEGNPYLSQINTVLEMAKRRPVRASDIAQTLNQSIHDVENLLDGLLIKGDIQKQEFGDECFYVSK